ncbi:MAG: sodium:proline symporter, partial [Pseudohongiella sp.]|nr:sodium:proline symporter [Pseudohongiella sp.]
TVLIWSRLSGGVFDLYEIVPGFLLASLMIVVLSGLRPQQDSSVLQQFDAIRRRLLDE